jgi:hypothetical protein
MVLATQTPRHYELVFSPLRIRMPLQGSRYPGAERARAERLARMTLTSAKAKTINLIIASCSSAMAACSTLTHWHGRGRAGYAD